MQILVRVTHCNSTQFFFPSSSGRVQNTFFSFAFCNTCNSEIPKYIFLLSEDSIQEKRDVDELEGDTDTRKLFMKQGNLEEQMQKEISEYLDAKNKEVNSSNEIVSDFLSFL